MRVEGVGGENLLGNSLEGNAGVSNTLDGASIASGRLDTDTIHRVLDYVVREGYSIDDIVISSAYGAYRQTVASGTGTTGEGNFLTEC